MDAKTKSKTFASKLRKVHTLLFIHLSKQKGLINFWYFRILLIFFDNKHWKSLWYISSYYSLKDKLFFFFFYWLFNVDELKQFLVNLIDNILTKINVMVYIKNNITECLITNGLFFIWFYIYIHTFSQYCRKTNDVSLWGIN